MLQKAVELIENYERLKQTLVDNKTKIEQIKRRYEKTLKSRDFLIQFSMFVKEQIKNKTEELANSALRCIYNDKVMLFKIIPNQTKRGLQYDLFIETDGNMTPLLDCKGGGVLDVISMALLISFLIINSHKTDKVLILDEPFKNLDELRLNNAILWLKGISNEFGIQFIIVSHEDGIIENADKIYTCSHDGEQSVIS